MVEYIHPGDLLEFVTDIDLLCFDLPRYNRSDFKCIISAFKGDIVKYVGVRYKSRTNSIFNPIPIHEFVLIRLDDDGNIKSEDRFYMPNIETILKWTELVE
jgi:hypothetical protein